MAKKSPLFAVYRSGVCMMSTEYESCVPDGNTLKQMQKWGYTFKRDGKAWKPTTRRKDNG